MTDQFGEIFVSAKLEQTIIDTLKRWFPTYLQEIELQLGRTRGQIPAPKSWAVRNRFDKMPENQMPGIVVFIPGLDDVPTMEGDGTIMATWRVGIAGIVYTSEPNTTNLVAKIYGAVIRGIMEQKGGEAKVFSGIKLVDETYAEVPQLEDDGMMGVVALYFRVSVDQVVNKYLGPASPIPDPDTQPGAQYPLVEKVIIEMEKEAL